jgi:hypothetical protein
MVNTTKRTKASPAAGARSKEGRPSTARIPPGDNDISGKIGGFLVRNLWIIVTVALY